MYKSYIIVSINQIGEYTGKIINDFKILKPLGQGSYGAVYEIEHINPNEKKFI